MTTSTLFLAVQWRPYSDEFTRLSFVGALVVLVGIWVYFRSKSPKYPDVQERVFRLLLVGMVIGGLVVPFALTEYPSGPWKLLVSVAAGCILLPLGVALLLLWKNRR
ncbi:hypothetical protein GCM10009801_58930 [Streptomyces albiaxialis]|uniref:Integral membrane protein n=1 Tax=Streptomyces albiaxialis TaxID=329523 RepID=A0ABN2WHE9_9ACTN